VELVLREMMRKGAFRPEGHDPGVRTPGRVLSAGRLIGGSVRQGPTAMVAVGPCRVSGVVDHHGEPLRTDALTFVTLDVSRHVRTNSSR
jgi:hypothetical protein